MASEEQEQPVSGGTLQWLQDGLHNAKQQATKVEQQVEQLQALFSQLAEQTRRHDDSLGSLSAQVAALSTIQEEMHKLESTAVRLRDEQERIHAQIEEVVRQQQAENERSRSERAEITRRHQEMERQAASLLERQGSLEEAGRRYLDTAAAAAQRLEQIEQRLEDLDTRAARNLEAVNRLEGKLPEVDTAIENAMRATETGSERVRLLGDIVRRVESEIADAVKQIRAFNDIPERVELARVARQRLDARATHLEEIVNGLSDSREEQHHLLAALEGKHHGYEGRLDALIERMEEYRQQFSDYLLKLTQGQEQLKRRQIGDLEREIKELEQYALGLFRE